MKHLKSIFMLLIISVVLMACNSGINQGSNIITNDNGKLIKIYSDSNLVIYKHKINPNHGWDFIYVNKNGGVIMRSRN